MVTEKKRLAAAFYVYGKGCSTPFIPFLDQTRRRSADITFARQAKPIKYTFDRAMELERGNDGAFVLVQNELPGFRAVQRLDQLLDRRIVFLGFGSDHDVRSEEHTSELQSLMRISYAVFCLKKKKTQYKPYHSNKLKT